MKKIFILILLFSGFVVENGFSQSISGKITDASNSDPLIGAIVKVQGLQKGAAADLDGLYEIIDIPPGIYTLAYSYIGYENKIVKDVRVTEGQNTTLNIALNIEGIITEEIEVEATTSLANEQSMLLEQKNSDKVQDGISEQQIKRAPDAAASEVLKRVIGVNILNDKFVYVRGTSERYNNTTLNGVVIPSSEPDKKAFSFDIFPSNLLENIIIAKSYTPDLPGNFSGGLVQINTKDFPEALSFNFSTSGSYNTNTTREFFRSYSAANKKFLFFNSGIDDGDRELPLIIPQNKIDNVSYGSQELKLFGKSFRNDWGQRQSSAPANGGFQISLGNRLNLAGNPFGVFAAYTYSNSFNNKDIKRTEYQADGNLEQEFEGMNSEYHVQMGGILNLSYKLGDNNKVSIKNSYISTSEDETQYLEGKFVPQLYDRQLFSTNFRQRDVISTQIFGDHYIHQLNNLSLTWKASYSQAKLNQPDYKTMIYQRETGSEEQYYAPIATTGNPNTSVGGRFFSDLKDISRSFEVNFEIPLKIMQDIPSKVKFGTFVSGMNRSFNARLFAPYFSNQINIFELTRIRKLSLDSIFMAENIDTNKIVISEFTDKSDKYTAEENQYAGYMMFDIPFGKFKAVTGARYEYNEQKLNSFSISSQEPVNVNLKNIDILPALNLIYTVNDLSNLRFSFFQSISRPELRELAPFGFNDFNSNIFIYGNPDLRRTLIRNFDLRYEIFPQAGEILSASLFYKKIDAPIERVWVANGGSDTKSNTFENAKNGAENYGVEFEIRKNFGFLNIGGLDFINSFLDNLTFNGNFTLIDSKIDLSGLGSTETKTERRMQGQSPYTINLGLYYDNHSTGTSINLLYNKFGKRISEVGIGTFGDIEENSSDIIDFSAAQKLFSNFEAKFTVKNLLNKKQVYSQEVNDVERTVREFKTGTTFTFSLGYKF